MPARAKLRVLAVHSSQGTGPADGRLRGPDFTGLVTSVAWPQSVQVQTLFGGTSCYVAGPGYRLVTFTLSVSQPSSDAGRLNPATALAANVEVGRTQLPVPMNTIDDGIAEAGGSTRGTGK